MTNKLTETKERLIQEFETKFFQPLQEGDTPMGELKSCWCGLEMETFISQALDTIQKECIEEVFVRWGKAKFEGATSSTIVSLFDNFLLDQFASDTDVTHKLSEPEKDKL